MDSGFVLFGLFLLVFVLVRILVERRTKESVFLGIRDVGYNIVA
jgi:hypothetical protein